MQQDAHWSNQSEIPCIQSITLSITAYVQEKVNTASVEEGFFLCGQGHLKNFCRILGSDWLTESTNNQRPG